MQDETIEEPSQNVQVPPSQPSTVVPVVFANLFSVSINRSDASITFGVDFDGNKSNLVRIVMSHDNFISLGDVLVSHNEFIRLGYKGAPTALPLVDSPEFQAVVEELKRQRGEDV